jgi:prephenate dehydratase
MTISPLSTVGYLGIPGTYSHQAAMLVAPDGDLRGFASFDLLFDALNTSQVLSAVFPVSNSTTGAIPQVKTLLEQQLHHREVARITLPIEHALIVKSPDVQLGDLIEVRSHPQGFLQCDEFMAESLPNVRRVQTPDTASAVHFISQQSVAECMGRAAIGSLAAAEHYHVHVLMPRINDAANNTTTFTVLTLPPRP